MPPCSWIASWPICLPERPIWIFAAEIARWRSVASSSSAVTAANIAMLRACSSATSMSTERCCNTWKLPIGRPNCWRVFRYSSVVSCITCMVPTASAHSAAIASSTACSIAGRQSVPNTASAATRTPDSVSSAARSPSCVG